LAEDSCIAVIDCDLFTDLYIVDTATTIRVDVARKLHLITAINIPSHTSDGDTRYQGRLHHINDGANAPWKK